MKQSRLNKRSGAVAATAGIALLSLLALTPGCGQNAANRAEEEKKFLAPTDVNKLRPEAREALSHMPGGANYQPPGKTPR